MTKGKTKLGKVLIIIGKILACTALLIVISAYWSATKHKSDLASYMPEGQMVEVNGHQMHVYVTGERSKPNDPAIVMISGLGTPSPTADFYPLWSELNKEYMIAVLERPGYGWSEETNASRTLDNIVYEDYLALEKAGISPPYLLVAHSLGGVEAHLFAGTYPNDVSGLLLLDCMSPELYLNYGEAPIPPLTKLAPTLRATGLLRLADKMFPNAIKNLSQENRNDFTFVNEHYRDLDRIITLNVAYGKNVREETELKLSNAVLANEVSLPPNLQTILMVPQLEESKGLPGYDEYLEIQSRWIAQSSKGRLEDCNTGHYVHQYDPELVIQELAIIQY